MAGSREHNETWLHVHRWRFECQAPGDRMGRRALVRASGSRAGSEAGRLTERKCEGASDAIGDAIPMASNRFKSWSKVA